MDASAAFLAERGERLIHHPEGAADDLQRALYLLDVIPEHRFEAGGVQIMQVSAPRGRKNDVQERRTDDTG